MNPDQAFVQGNGEHVRLAEGGQAISVAGHQGLFNAVDAEVGKRLKPSLCFVHAHLAEGAVGVHAQGEGIGGALLSDLVEHVELLVPVEGTDLAFQGGESLLGQPFKLPEHVFRGGHPNKAIDVDGLFSCSKRGFCNDATATTMQVPSGGFDGKPHGGA